jgi:hypothetical protein
MKRRNVQMAFVGEGTTAAESSVEGLVEGDEAIDIEIRGGKLQVIVPAATPDERIFEVASLLGGELRLENGMTVTFEIKDGAEGAQFAAMSTSDEPGDTHTGLSSIPNIPGGA